MAKKLDNMYRVQKKTSPGLQVLFMASGGAFWMIWHLLTARVL